MHQVIQAGHVMLRPTGPGDLDGLRAFFAEPAVFEHWGGAPLEDGEIAAKYLGARSPRVECFIVEVDAEPAGFMQYWEGDGEGGGIDLVLTEHRRGAGVGTAAVHALVGFLRQEHGWQRITVDPDVANTNGVRFWETVGFVPERKVESDADRGPYWLMAWP